MTNQRFQRIADDARARAPRSSSKLSEPQPHMTEVPIVTGDVRALSATLMAMMDGYERLDATTICQMFDEEGEWVDAAGRHFRGRAQIRDHLSELFARGWIPGDVECVQPSVTAQLVQPDITVAWVSSPATDCSLPGQTENEPLGELHRLLVLRWTGIRWFVTTEFILDAGVRNHVSW